MNIGNQGRPYQVQNNIELPMPSMLRNGLAGLGRNWGWLVAGGLCFIGLGVTAYLWPVDSTVSLTLALGVLFVISGIVRLVQAIQLRQEIGTGWRVLDVVVSLAAGVLLLRYPGGGMLAVAIAMIFYFFMSATTKTVIAFATRPLPGSGWVFVSAICSFALGVYMLVTFPVSALWVPGALFGIEFVVFGVSLIGFAFTLRRLHHEIEHNMGKPLETGKAA